MKHTFTTSIPYTFALFLGVALMFGSTSFSVFEIIACVAIALTLIVILKSKRDDIYTLILEHKILSLLAILHVVQLLYITTPNVGYVLVTLYLIFLFRLINFWFCRDSNILVFALRGYLIATIGSSTLGLVGYIGKIFDIPGIQGTFFWDSVRVSVFYSDPVVYGAFLVPALLFLGYKTCTTLSLKESMLYGSLTLLLFSNIILSGSRGAWLNLLISSLLLLILYTHLHTKKVYVKILAFSPFVIVIGLLIMFVIPLDHRSYYSQTMETRSYSSDKPRLEHLQTVPALLRERTFTEKVFGAGSGTYEFASKNGFSAHSIYLRTFYELGIIGTLLFGAFIVGLFRKLLVLQSSNPLHATFFLSLLSGVLVQGLFVDVIHWRHFWFIISFIV